MEKVPFMMQPRGAARVPEKLESGLRMALGSLIETGRQEKEIE